MSETPPPAAPTPSVDDLRQRLRAVLRRGAQPGPPWLPPVHDVARIDATWILVAATMLLPAIVFFGWRGAMQVGVTALSTTAAHTLIETLLRSLRLQRARWISPHAFALGLLLGLCMPLSLGPLVPAVAGTLLGVVIHLVGRSHAVRVHPVAVVLVLLALLPRVAPTSLPEGSAALQSVDAVLAPQHVLLGDVTHFGPDPVRQPWWSVQLGTRDEAISRNPPHEQVLGHLDALLGDANHLRFLLSSTQLPRLEEVILGMTPGPIGATSPLLLILIGLVLIHRRLSSWRIVGVAALFALLTLLLTPRETDAGLEMIGVSLWRLDPAAAVTFVAYFFLSSPLPLILCVLAPLSSPMARAGRYIYGVVLGVSTVSLLLLTGEPAMALVGLVLAGCLARPLDALHRSPFVD